MNPLKRHEQYRTFGSYASFAEADAERRDYWRSRTPLERLVALEELRIRVYGEAAINAKAAKVFGIVNRANIEKVVTP